MYYQRHWSFIVCDKRYLYPLAIGFVILGIILAILLPDYQQLNRIGNIIVAIGVWMSMRSTLREGINKVKNYSDSFPITPGTIQVNTNYFRKNILLTGDAYLQVHGFILVLIGSIVGSYGDLILKGVVNILFST